MTEIWKSCVGYTEYEVSDLGRVRSLDTTKWNGPAGFGLHKGRILKSAIGSHGYPYVQLGKGKVRTIHSLVLEAFIGPRPEGMESCHGNGNKLDCCLENLRWDFPKGNADDKRKHGTNLLSGRKAAETRQRMITMSGYFSVEDMSRAGCTTPRGIRFWEEQGLLGKVERSDKGTRRFSDEQMDKARIIAAAQFGNFSLDVIKQMLIEWGPEVADAIVTRLSDQAHAAARLVEQLPKPPEKPKGQEYDL